MISTVLQAVLWFLVWIFLHWMPDVKEIVLGIPVSIFIAFMTVDMLGRTTHPFKKPKKILWFGYYVIIFLWECLKANIDVAYRVIHPDLPIRPGTIKVKTNLKSDIGLTFLANSITLTPGTTTVDIDKERGFIYIHWLYVKDGYDPSSMKLDVVDKFENILKKIFR